MRLLRLLIAAAALAPFLPAAVRAQPLPGGFGAAGPAWTPIVSARLGWSLLDSSPAAGAQLRLPLPLAAIRPSIAVGGDVVFQSGLRERQGTADLTVGFFSPIYLGGGPAVLSSVFPDEPERATKAGFSVVGGVRGGRTGPFLTDIEFRWVRVAELKPRYLSLLLGYPLPIGR